MIKFHLTLTKIKPFVLPGAILVILLVIGVIGIIVSYWPKQPPRPTPVPYQPTTPPLTRLRPLRQPPNFQTEFAKIQSILPYQGQNYLIKYIRPINIIEVSIEASGVDEFIKTRQEVEAFLRSKGVEDLCALNIFWIPPRDPVVRKSIPAKEVQTTGCSLFHNKPKPE